MGMRKLVSPWDGIISYRHFIWFRPPMKYCRGIAFTNIHWLIHHTFLTINLTFHYTLAHINKYIIYTHLFMCMCLNKYVCINIYIIYTCVCIYIYSRSIHFLVLWVLTQQPTPSATGESSSPPGYLYTPASRHAQTLGRQSPFPPCWRVDRLSLIPKLGWSINPRLRLGIMTHICDK